MKNAVYCDITLYDFCNKRFGGTYRLHYQVESSQRARKDVRCNYPVTSNVVPSSLITFTLMMMAIISSETSALTRATQRHILMRVISV
jgi:hypothetical protein